MSRHAAFWPNASTVANANYLPPPVDWTARAAALRREQEQRPAPQCTPE